MSSDTAHLTGQLIQPSTYRPWSVEVVSAVPQSIMTLGEGVDEQPKKKKKKLTTGPMLESSQINTGAVCPGWACLASWKGSLYVWPVSTHTSGSTGTSPTKHKPVEAPRNCVTLFHPSLVSISEDSSPPLIAMTPASPDAVYVYVCNPGQDSMVVWKVTRDDVRRTTGLALAHAHTVLPLDRQEMDDEGEIGDGELEEHAASITVVDRHMVVVGTTKGAMISVTQSTIPLALHSLRMLSAAPSRRSLVGRLFFGTDQEDGFSADESQMKFALPMPSVEEDCTELLAVSLFGTIWHWKIKNTVAASHRVNTEATCLTTIATLILQFLPSLSLTGVEILQAKLLGQRMHILVRTTQESESRLFWIRLRVDREGPKVALDWMDCQWLNRYPAPQDVQAMGLVLSQDDIAYAAFHQGSGGVTSSVIVMALVDSKDTNDESASRMTVYEVDLPLKEIPALIPGTFANDVVTHGVCIFSRSGLGIRVRALPPASTAAALSPRAIKRANPANILKLSNHLRGTFWQSYNHHQSAGSFALPPSIAEASAVDLEEAVIVVATDIHTQKSSDATGWASVSTALDVNALEHHLAFITWLRQGGIYRSLSIYGRWRLLAIGQEIAAFLDLTGPTMSPNTTQWEKQQIATLSISKVATWLKEELEKTLRDGGMDHYQLWCGWFSTALATSMTYRKERAGATYDITRDEPPPPAIGSKNSDEDEDTQAHQVPIWTSHPVLQEIFGVLLQHWRAKQKSFHVLPPQTLEIIVRAALNSFADSANSLSSDRANGRYAEVKSLTIPLLRNLHPPNTEVPTSGSRAHSDDILAFQLAVRHDYYEGICQMALDHENKLDADNFRLGPLLKSTDQCQSMDFQSGFTFGQFVLQWHTDRELFGHTILYGRLCPERDLNHILQSDERLRPYRWIQAVHKGDYNGAAISLMGQSEKSATANLSETKWSFSMAKLANHVALKESQQRREAEEREAKINNTLELVGVQKELFDDTSSLHLWSPNRLLSRALEKMDQAMAQGTENRTEDATKYAYLGLLVCATFEDKIIQQRQASQVWAKTIQVDWESQWAEWIRTEDDLSRDTLARTILDTTVFGGLLQECAGDSSLSTVTYCKSMEQQIIQQMGFGTGGVDSLCRLLSTVKAFLEASDEEDTRMAVEM